MRELPQILRLPEQPNGCQSCCCMTAILWVPLVILFIAAAIASSG